MQQIGKIEQTSNKIKRLFYESYIFEYHILYLPCCGISEKNDTKNLVYNVAHVINLHKAMKYLLLSAVNFTQNGKLTMKFMRYLS